MSTPSTTPRPLTGDPIIDATTHGYYWNIDSSRTLNWSLANGFSGEFWISPSTTVAALKTVFDVFSSYADIHFKYAGSYANPSAAYSGGSDITISLDGVFLGDDSIWAIGLFPDASYNSSYYQGAPGDVFLNINSLANSLPSYAPGSAGYALAIHEIGHTLGLKHPFDDGGTGHPTLADIGYAELDKDWATVMAYDDDYDWNLTSWDPATPMVLDVLALQYIYGPNTTKNATNTTYTLPLNGLYATIWDAGGTDLIKVSGSPVSWTIALPDLQLSTLVSTKVGWALPTDDFLLPSPHNLYWLMGDIENATGSNYNDDITGNQLNNILNGGAGADTMAGGDGNDTYVVDNTGDLITENASEGADLIQSSVTYTLPADVENLTLTGTSAINGIGNTLSNIITGNRGANVIDGGTGADTMVGGKGNDTYVVDDAGDVITDLKSGTDLIQSSVTYTLPANVENLTLTGISALNGTGNSAANVLTGNSGANVLNGGAGADTMIGGLGNDTYVVDKAKDIVTENSSSGTDLIQSSVTYTLPVNVENLTLTGTSAINGTGNDAANTLIGNSGANKLIGGGGNDTLDGGSGADTLTGGSGADTFIFDAINAFNGIDKVTDFSAGAGDALDISNILAGYSSGTDLLTSWVQIADSGSDSIVSVDFDGAGTSYLMVQIAMLTGITGLTDEAALVTSNNLVV